MDRFDLKAPPFTKPKLLRPTRQTQPAQATPPRNDSYAKQRDCPYSAERKLSVESQSFTSAQSSPMPRESTMPSCIVEPRAYKNIENLSINSDDSVNTDSVSDREISHLRYQNARLMRELAEKKIEMRELKSQLADYNAKLKSKELQQLESQLEEKDKEVETMRTKLKSYETEARGKIEAETKRLSKLIEEGDNRLNELYVQMEVLTVRNSELELRHRQSDYTRTVAELRLENKRLQDQIDLSQLVKQQELRQVDSQIKELELFQDSLLAENKRLKAQLESKPALAQVDPVTLHKIRLEISQLTAVAKTLRANQPLTLKVLLGVKELQPEEGEDAVVREVERLKTEVSGLRNCISDMYAEQCGSLCLTQCHL